MSGLTMPVQHLYLQLADPWTTPDYTDITPLMKQWSGVVRGRQHELQLFQAGQVALTMEASLTQGRFSPWNTNGAYYNLLSADDAAQVQSNGTWGNPVNCDLEPWGGAIPPVLLDGDYALEMAFHPTSPGTINTGHVYDVVAGHLYSVMCSFLANSTGRACTIGIQWYNASNALISTSTTPSVTDLAPVSITNVAASGGVGTITATQAFSVGQHVNISGLTNTALNGNWAIATANGFSFTVTTGSQLTIASVADSGTAGVWLKASLLGVKAPVGAVTAALIITVTSAADAELHWACRAALFNYTSNVPNTAWAPGQRGLVPGRPMYLTATWDSVTYDIWSMYVSNFTPQYGQSKSDQVINCSDGLALLSLSDINSSAYANQVLADGATNFWRCGDASLSLQAADSGPDNQPLTANFITFGAASPMLTDDTTTAAFQASTSLPAGSLSAPSGTYFPAVGAGSLELLFAMPAQSNVYTFLFNNNMNGTTNGGYIYYDSVSTNLVVGAAGTSPIGVVEAAPSVDNGEWHHLVVTWSAITNGTLSVYLDGALLGSMTAGVGDGSALLASTSFPNQGFVFGTTTNSTVFPPTTYNGEMADIAYYPYLDLTLAQVQNHYALFQTGWAVQYSGYRIQEILTVLGWPSDLQNIAMGISEVQGATTSLTQTTALSYMQTVESTEMGALFIAPNAGEGVITYYDRHYIITATAATVSNGTFSNNPATGGAYHYLPGLVPAMDDTDLWNDVPGQRNGGVLQRSTNALSVQQYGKRTLTGFTGELQTSDAEVESQTQWLLAHYDEPITRCRAITLSSVTDAGANLPQMLGRGIFDLITLIWNPIDGSTVYFTQGSLIESIQHTVTQSKWLTTWGLTPAETQPYMILNDTVRGQLSTDNLLGY